MSDARTLRRVKNLLAQAGDPTVTEEEARTFAVEAARLIRKHGLQVAPEGEPAPRRPTPRPADPPPPTYSPFTAAAAAAPRYYDAQPSWRHVERMSATVPCALGCCRPIRRGEAAWHKLGTGDFIHDEWGDCGPGA